MSPAADIEGRDGIEEGDIERRQFTVERQLAEELGEREIRFRINTPSEDRDEDVIEPSGAQTEAFEKNPVFLWQHLGFFEPIGKVVRLDEGEDEIIADVRFIDPDEMPEDDDHAQFADRIFRMYKEGYLNSVSIGFLPVDFERRDDDKGGFRFVDWELIELSAVVIPSNRDATAIERDVAQDYEKKVNEWSKSWLEDLGGDKSPEDTDEDAPDGGSEKDGSSAEGDLSSLEVNIRPQVKDAVKEAIESIEIKDEADPRQLVVDSISMGMDLAEKLQKSDLSDESGPEKGQSSAENGESGGEKGVDDGPSEDAGGIESGENQGVEPSDAKKEGESDTLEESEGQCPETKFEIVFQQ